MDLLQSVSYMKAFWGAQAALYGGVTAFSLLSGYVPDKTANHKDPDEKLSLLQFRRRLSLYYTVGLLSCGWVGWNMFSVYYWGGAPNHYLNSLANTLNTPSTPANIGSTRVLLAGLLFEFHLLRRLLETSNVQVMSRKQVLGPLQTLLSLVQFPLAALTLYCDFFPPQQHTPLLSLSDLRLVDGAAVLVFLGASYASRTTFQQLAKLRRNRFGHVTNTAYKMPQGSMFSRISCPHYLAELLVYGSLAAILGCDAVLTGNGSGGSTTWLWLCGHVASVHLWMAHSTHAWYRQKFPEYPPERKRLIPFLF